MFVPKINRNLIPRVKRAAFQKIKHIALSNGGIIFGGFVRDEYISEYYSAKFKKDAENQEKYWDCNYSPETKARLLMPSDMDVSFDDSVNANKFIEILKETNEFDYVYVSEEIEDSHYYGRLIKSVRKARIDLVIGAVPFVYEGTPVTIEVDIVLPIKKNIEPPFMNLDMLCNGFIIKSDGQKMFSRHTGTIIDHYSDYERTMVVAQILKDMKDFKTVLCFTTKKYNKMFNNIVAFKRIEKMQKKALSWSFINLPFKTETFDDKNEISDCCICTKDFKNGDKIAYTSCQKDDTIIKSPKIHYKCCMKHLRFQSKTATNHHDKKFIFRCPFRNDIDFTRCILDIQFIYKFEL